MADQEVDDIELEGLGGDEEQERRDEFLRTYLTPAGAVNPDLWRQGVEDFLQMPVIADVSWTQIGPAPLSITPTAIGGRFQGAGPDSGEVTDISIDPHDATGNTIYIATNDGGVWKTTDGGTTWQPKTDVLHSLSMGAVAVDPFTANTVWAGTGNLFDGGSVFTKGVGLLKSTDGGETWAIVDGGPFATVFAGLGINRIAIPAANVLLVATNKGLFRSANGGLTFGANAPDFDDGKPVLPGFVTALALDTQNPATTVFAAVSKVGLFRSTDAGVTFPSNLFLNAGAPANPFGNIAFAQSTQNANGTANNQVLYVSVAGAPYAGLFRSNNGGAAWFPLPAANAPIGGYAHPQEDYDLTVGVDPQDPQRVFIAVQEMFRSTNGGTNFGTPACTSPQVHWDHHAIVFVPRALWGAGAPTRFYVGTDGGIATTADGGTNWTNLNAGIATNLLLGIDIGRGSAANNAFTYGGAQDTGNSGRRGTDPPGTWLLGYDGDGGQFAVDPANPLNVYGTSNGNFLLSTNGGFPLAVGGGASWVSGSGAGLPAGSVDLLAVDPNHGNVVYATSHAALYRSANSGANFTLAHTFGDDVTALATTPADSNRMWVGLGDGTVQRSANAGNGPSSTWTAFSPGGTGAAEAIAIDPADSTRVVVVYSGHSGIHPAFRTRHCYMTEDDGATWNDVSGTDGNAGTNLPDLPLFSVVVDSRKPPVTITVASDAGVLRSVDKGATWQVLGVGLPTVNCRSLAYDGTAAPPLLRVGTYGRSCFELTAAAAGPRAFVRANLGFGVVKTGTVATLPLEVFNAGDASLKISGIARTAGDAAFDLDPAFGAAVDVPPGMKAGFKVKFAPAADGDVTASFRIDSNDAAAPQRTVLASATAASAPAKPRAALFPPGGIGFGTVKGGASRDLDVTVFNVGLADLTLTGIDRKDGSSDFDITAAPGFPTTILPGGDQSFTVRFKPGSNGAIKATFEVKSNDARSPATIEARGTGVDAGTPALTIILVVLGAAVLVGGAVIAHEEGVF